MSVRPESMADELENAIHIDDINGVTVADPEPGADLTLAALEAAMASIHAKDPDTFENNAAAFEEIMVRLLSKQKPERVVVPTKPLFP